MPENFKKRKEENELIRRFEDLVKNKANHFFELDSFEQIIDYYVENGKYNKALIAVNIAYDQYPFSTELLINKAQILSNLEKYNEALELLEHAESLQPNDSEIYFLKGSILSLLGQYHDSIECYDKALLFTEDKDEAYYSLGLAYQSLEDYGKAIEAYKNAIEENIYHEGSPVRTGLLSGCKWRVGKQY